MSNVITKTQFLVFKKKQQLDMWTKHQLSDKDYIDWLLVHGNDQDIEMLCDMFDPMAGIAATV